MNDTQVKDLIREKMDALRSDDAVRSDRQFNGTAPKEQHDNAYTSILNAYAENINETLRSKKRFKKTFFILSYTLLAGSFLSFFLLIMYLIVKKPLTEVVEWCSVVVPALVSFLTVFIVIPKIIAEYLFNSEEEKYMSEIIKNLQDYDKEG